MNKITPEATQRCAAHTLSEQLAQLRETLTRQEQRNLAQARQAHEQDQGDVTLYMRNEHKRGFE